MNNTNSIQNQHKNYELKQRERLVELLEESSKAVGQHIDLAKKIPTAEEVHKMRADYLLANGVIVPPCKAGDTVYAIYDKKVYEAVCEYVTTVQHKEGSFTKIKAEFDIEDSFYYDGRKTRFGVYGMYETDVFLTKEEADEALKGGVQG